MCRRFWIGADFALDDVFVFATELKGEQRLQRHQDGDDETERGRNDPGRPNVVDGVVFLAAEDVFEIFVNGLKGVSGDDLSNVINISPCRGELFVDVEQSFLRFGRRQIVRLADF